MTSLSLLAWIGLLVTLAAEITALCWSRNLYRMLVASTIAEVGYVLMGLGVGTGVGDAGAMLHIIYQVIMRALVVLAAIRLVRGTGSSRLSDLAGSARRFPFAALMFGFGMFSVIGLSPFKGALSKFIILYAALDNGQWLLALGGTIASIIAAIYFIRTIQVICFQQGPDTRVSGVTTEQASGLSSVLSWANVPMLLLALITIVLSLYPEPLLEGVEHAAGLVTAGGLPHFETTWSLPVLVPYLGGFVLFVIGRLQPRIRDWGGVLVALATLAVVVDHFQVGDLGSYFALVFAGGGLAVVVYSIRYMAHSHALNRYVFFLFLMIGSLIGVATSDHLGNFYLFWELMTWTSYLLVIHEQTDKALRAGMKYFLICTSGAYVMHFGILLLHARLGTFDLAFISAHIGELSPTTAAIVLGTFLVGLCAKAGFFPLHSWLPDAHPVAPASISAPMSGILTKAGIFGIIKLMFGVFGVTALAREGRIAGLSDPGAILLTLACITFLIGEIQAYRQTDLKRMLAYSTLAQVGEIGLAIGVGTYLSLTGGLVHVANHALMKTLLFLTAGAFIMRLGRQSLDDLKGIGRVMPFTALTMGIGLLAIMGLPPFGGFVGKFLIIYACAKAGLAPVAAVMLAGSVIAAMYYARILRTVFFEKYEGPAVSDAPLSMKIVMGVLAALIVVNGVYPQALMDLVTPIMAGLAARGGMTVAALPPLTIDWSWASAIAVVGGLIVYVLGKGSALRSGVLSVVVMVLALAAILAQPDRYDALSFWYAILIVCVGGLNLTFSIGYMAHGHAAHRYFMFFLLMIGGLLGVTASTNLFSFFAFWEVMSSWTLYLVIIHEETREALREGTKYFIFNVAGASFLFLGVAMLAAGAGTFDLASLKTAVAAMPAGLLAVSAALILAGFVMKAAQVPVRIDYQMHPAPAPTPVSGYISAVLLKMGPYGVLKFFVVLGAGVAFARISALGNWGPNLMEIISVIAAITMLYAGAMAVIENGIKRLLIYSTVSQLGYILLGLSIGTPLAVAGGLAHAVNHMLVKDVLFLVAGCILAQAHVTRLDDLGGLAKRMPITFGIFLIAGLSVSGIPPLAGFASKWMIYEAAFQGGHYILALSALMSSLFTLAAVMKFAHAAFLGQVSPLSERLSETPRVMLVPMLVLLSASLLVGMLPGLVLVPVSHVQAALGLQPIHATWLGGLPGPHGWHPLGLSLGLLAVGLLAWGYRRLAVRGRVVSHIHACGVTSIEASAMHVKASNLYETPDRILRHALHAKPVIESSSHD